MKGLWTENKEYMSDLNFLQNKHSKINFCHYLWSKLLVLPDGSVRPCTIFDIDPKYDFGNIIKDNYSQIRNNKYFVEARKDFSFFRKNRYSLCKNCFRLKKE